MAKYDHGEYALRRRSAFTDPPLFQAIVFRLCGQVDTLSASLVDACTTYITAADTATLVARGGVVSRYATHLNQPSATALQDNAAALARALSERSIAITFALSDAQAACVAADAVAELLCKAPGEDHVLGVAKGYTAHVLSVLLSAVLAVEAASAQPPDGGASPVIQSVGSGTSISVHPITHAVVFKLHLAIRKVISAYQPYIGSVMLAPASASLQDAFNIKRPQLLADRLQKFLTQS